MSESPFKNRLRRSIRVVLCVFAAIGMWKAIKTSREAAFLQAELFRLESTFGSMRVEDPNRVYVLAMPQEDKRTWRFRCYFPKGYDAMIVRYSGHISATTPRSSSVSGSSSSLGSGEAGEDLLTLAFTQGRRGWEVHSSTMNSRGVNGLSAEIIKMIEDPSTTVVDGVRSGESIEFAVDQPICLLRIRGTKPVEEIDGPDPLYDGFHYYIIPKRMATQLKRAASQSTAVPSSR